MDPASAAHAAARVSRAVVAAPDRPAWLLLIRPFFPSIARAERNDSSDIFVGKWPFCDSCGGNDRKRIFRHGYRSKA